MKNKIYETPEIKVTRYYSEIIMEDNPNDEQDEIIQWASNPEETTDLGIDWGDDDDGWGF